MKSNMEPTMQQLPSGPPTLCFEKDDFMKESFHVEQFTVECRRRVPLETLRDDLSVYLKILQTAMIELINKDYADFVNLSTNLVGVDKALSSLITPLGQLREEVMNVSESLDEAIGEVETKMKQQQDVRERKLALQRLMSIVRAVEKIEKMLNLHHSSDDSNGDIGPRELKGQLLERVGTEFNKLQFFVNKCRGMSLVEQIRPRIANITVTLQHSLEGTLKEGIENNDIGMLCQCLRTYATIDKMKDAQALFRQEFVRPYMEDIINDDFMREHPDGLQGMYNAILDFIPKHCSKLLHITTGIGGTSSSDTVQGYDFLVNAVWPEIVSNIEARTPSIFAPGNPQVFHEKYLLSISFINKYERACGSQSSVKRLRAHPSYATFMNKWSLPVYFQIRFQEIAGTFENALCTPFNIVENGTFKIQATENLWWCLSQCWKEEVFLEPLCHRFWKMSLQILARYANWIDEVATSQLPRITETKSLVMTPSASTNKLGNGEPEQMQRSASPVPTTPPLTMGQIIKLIADVNSLTKTYIFKFFADIVEPVLLKMGVENTNMLKESLEDSIQAIRKPMIIFNEFIVKDLTAQGGAPLKLVNDIPRLYRRTNRDIPSKCSPYISSVMKPLEMFVEEHQTSLSDENKREWLQQVLLNVSENYLSLTTDVLTSVKKMEESLKRLKKGKASSANLAAMGMSDDDKIRLQLYIDVQALGEQIDSLGLQRTSIDAFCKLNQLVESAKGSSQ